MRMSNRFLVCAAAVAAVSVANAQDSKGTGQGNNPTGQDKAGQDKPAGQDKAKADDKSTSMLRVFDAKEVIGAKVTNPQGEDLGKIDDVAVYSNGQIAYAVLQYGGVLGVGDKLFAVPWSLLRSTNPALTGGVVDKNDVDRHGDLKLSLNVDKERLKSAPGFDKGKWPTTASNFEIFDASDKYYDNERRTADADRRTNGGPVEASAARTPNTIVWRVSELKGKNLENSTGDKLGDIKEVYIDPSNGRINYVVASVGGFLGIGDRMVAVPWDAIKTTRMDNKEKLTLNTTKEQLEKAPQFKSDMHEIADPMWIGNVYTYYSVRPYWRDANATPPAPGSRDKPEKKY